MYGYDGELFETYEQFRQYLMAKYGDMGPANLASVTWWGEDLNGNYLYIDGIQQLGTEGDNIASAGFNNADDVLNAFDKDPVSFSADTFKQLQELKQAREFTVNGTTYQNSSMPLGSAGGGESSGNVLLATRNLGTENGTAFNNPGVMTAEKDPNDPLKWIGRIRAIGGLELPAWTVAAAPLLGVTLGVGLYEANPQFWERISRELLPYCYDDNGVPKMPITIDKSGNVHTSKNAIEKLREIFLDEGVFEGRDDFEPTPSEDVTNITIKQYATYDSTGTDYGGQVLFYDNAVSVYNTAWKIVKPSAVKGYVNGAVKQGFSLTYGNLGSETPVSLDYVILAAPIDPNAGVEIIGVIGSFPVNPPFNSMRYNSYLGGEFYNWTTNSFVGYSDYDKTHKIRCIGNLGLPNEPGTAALNGLVNPTGVSSYNTGIIPVLIYGTLTEGNVPGTSLEPGALYPTDTTQSLEDLYPTWYDNGIDVISNPVADLIEDAVERWVPLSLSRTNNSSDTDDVASTETQADAQEGTNTDNTQINQLADALLNLTKALTDNGLLPSDPTVPTDPSGETPTPTPPVITGAGSDLIAIYNPTKAQIQAFNSFLWSLDPTQLVNWKKVFVNPIEAVIALQMIYVTPITGETRNIKCGYIETNVPSKIVTNQYKEIDCGSVQISEYFHNVWDYIATDIQIYLPFIGILPLNVSDVMNSTIRLRYRVDVYTGTCLAQITVYKGNSWGTLYTFPGNCSVQLPITSGQFGAMWGAMIGAIGIGIGGAVAGIPGAGVMADNYAASKLMNSGGVSMQRSGHIGANAGALGIRTPYLIITRKVPLDAHLYETQYGFPANKTVVLGNMRGYTRVKDIHLSGIPCTDDELEQIESLLKDGVIIN